MKIALLHFRVGETDGVSLEMDKWCQALHALGHQTLFIAGNRKDEQTRVVPELAFNDPTDLELAEECYVRLNKYTPQSLESKIREVASSLSTQVQKIIREENVDVLVPNNVFALARSLPVALGLEAAIRATGIRVVCHHHDFYWERERYSHPTCGFVAKCLERLFPPSSSRIDHVVINSHAKAGLLQKKRLPSTIVPNVFDFDQPLWVAEQYNRDFKAAFGLDDRHVVFLQATRVVNRKAIELAIDLLARLNRQKHQLLGKKLYDGRIFGPDSELVLLCVGLHEGTNGYENRLREYATRRKVRMILDPGKVMPERSIRNHQKIYSLWDAYVFADIISYPSIYEGFGNQFLEAVFAKKPIFLFEYPVYVEDIKPHGFLVASLGQVTTVDAGDLVHVPESAEESCAATVWNYLFNPALREETIRRNFHLGATHYSLKTLKTLLQGIFHWED